MLVQGFLEHHGIERNPFAEEDAQTDPVFKQHCIASTYHPAWDKIYGDPADPSTSFVFGEKGAGKTAMRLQIANRLDEYNNSHETNRCLVIRYDDFNPFLDHFRERLGRKKPEKILASWKLWDHMDAILSLGVTGVVDRILEAKQPSTSVSAKLSPSDVDKLDHYQARDLLLLAACYDNSMAETFKSRQKRLRKRLKFSTWKSYLDLAGGIAWTAIVIVLTLLMLFSEWRDWIPPWYVMLPVLVAGWIPFVLRWLRCFRMAHGIARNVRVGNLDAASLRHTLMRFARNELAVQPVPNRQRTDDRYELLSKFQGILQTLGHTGVVVLVDRLDEPHLINGAAEKMRALVWPLLDNKLLKHPGMGLKLMMPGELIHFIDREDRDFHQRARLDKQNVIRSLEWTGESLYDIANARLAACSTDGKRPTVRDLLDESISEQRILEALRSLRVPRRLFKFMHRLLVTHCNAHTDQDPAYRIASGTFESALALQLRDEAALDQGLFAN